MTEITNTEMWIITALVTAAACVFIAWYLHKTEGYRVHKERGWILREQDEYGK